jgi:zinc protease
MRHFLWVAFLFSSVSCTWGETPAASLIKKIEFIEYDLENGLHVILHENHSAPVIATYVLYHVGSKNERADRTGFAHFFEHLMFEGSENISRGRIDKLVSAAGGNLNATTSFDRTDYFLNLPANQLQLALWIESERMMHAKIDETGVETQRQVVKEERRVNVDNRPYGTLFEKMASLVFSETPYSWTPIGSFQYIDRATIEEFREFYHTHYIPNNATLAIAGDVDVERTKKLVQEYFGPIPRGKDIPRPTISMQPPAAPKKEVVMMGNTPLPAALHAWLGPPETHPDAYAMDLLTDILGTGRSSRLHRRLVDQEQIASEISAFALLLEKAGAMAVMATGTPGASLQRVDELISEQIATVRENGVTATELEKAQNQKETEIAFSHLSMQNRARDLAHYHVFYGDAGRINTELQRYLAVTLEDIKRVAGQYLKADQLHVLHYPVVEKQQESRAQAK